MRPSKRLFYYSIPRYLPNALLQMSRLDIPFPAINKMLPSKSPV